MTSFGGPVTRRAVLGDISNRTAAHDAKLGKGSTKQGGFLGSQKGLGLGAEGTKTLGGLNPKHSLAHIDSSLRTVKLGEGYGSTDAPDPIDASDSTDAQCVVPYIKDIMRCMRETEGKYLAPPTYMAQQTDVNEKMRAILIDWLVEVHLKFKLVPETMYVTANLIDRFLSKKGIQRNKLQLVGVTAMFIASKYEEIYAPEVRDFVYISDKAYSREEILKMEATMLGALNFNVTAPSPYAFLKRFVKVAGYLRPEESREERLCAYLVELTLQEYRMLKYLPSVIAASAVCLAHKMLGSASWSSTLQQHTCYAESTLLPCMKDMNAIVKAASKNSLTAVRKKYSQDKLSAVALIEPVEL
ncbi:hypothetical protein KFE25_009308 [Diacronema lutheri]|uniref:Cyclin N-terminal domain-containing protein n=1 Tax=Diacronema lutheri TaxID=2081491 RepID=A0A8J6CDD7_DIALT|nr:hypothetical protein KFE25_009308 [Diacronema lutheri]